MALFLMIFCFTVFPASAEEKAPYKVPYIPATQIDFVITSACTFDPVTNLFKYEYKITSLPSSRQDIDEFIMGVLISEDMCKELKSPIGWSGWYSPWNSLVIYPTATITWGPKMDYRKEKKPAFPLRPGASMEGFSFKSEGLPGIVTTYSRGDVPIPVVPDDRPVIDKRPKAIDDCVKKKTIGPVPLPEEPVDPVTFAFRMQILTRQSGKLGWIKSETLTNKWAEILDGIKNYYGDKTRLKDTFNALITELESQRGKQIDDNAYYLLKLNAEFLLRKM